MTGILLAGVSSFILYAVLSIILIFNKKKAKTLTAKFALFIFIVLFIIASIVNYIFLVPITLPNMIIANLVMAVIGILLLYGMSHTPGTKKRSGPFEATLGLLIILAVLAIPTIFVTGIFTLDNSYESISQKEVEEAKPLSKEDTPITVSPEFARNKTQKSMSVIPNTQFYDLGKLQVQKVGDDVVFVGPVEFTGFWKWFRGKETEGYFTISATNVNAQPEFVESKMKYTNSSYFNKNVERVIYGAYPTYIQSGEAQIEVDKDGKPWYVQTLYQPIGLTNKPDLQDLKVAVVNPVNGDVKLYDTDNAPPFIDGSVSSEMASDVNEYFGKYVHGWLNSIFGKKDVKIPNESGTESSVTPIFNENGDMYYFTDMSSPKENIDSALGYTLINARTGTLTYYNGKKNSGIMDSTGAKEIVNKEFPEKNWEGSMPVLYNIDGNPTWVVNVLDPNGLFKKYAYIKASDSDFVVFGDTARETLEAYRLQLLQDPSNVSSSGETPLQKRSGEINRVLVTTQKNAQVVQFLLKGDKTIYTLTAGKAPLALFLQEGDKVQLEANIRDNGTGIVEKISIEGLTE
ncbi:DNA-binding protein [Virgibacillus phasianinus]|uniref:DNA-binding protein n=1 Tax=Virgibacillus phasianinus TaxID=2017483 RepID=A0A220TZ13_9BACI|nr:DNA-binding protein [Virgibacillus phasianinus]ASK61118.1 DNA-binding protein [Virgibacillus phasianinus]